MYLHRFNRKLLNMKTKPNYIAKIQQGMSAEQKLAQIVRDGMCIGCGICESVAGSANIKMTVLADGAEQPVVTGALDDQLMDFILTLCPGTRVNGLPKRLFDENTNYDKVWGFWRQLVSAFASDDNVRYVGSTGGLLTALALYLLESKTVDFILHAKASTSNPTFGEHCISRNREQVMAAAGARYGPTATLVNIMQIIARCEQAGETFALIGTPCDVTALRNLAASDSRVDKFCKYQLAVVCGGFMQPQAMADALENFGIHSAAVSEVRYRGYGCPGATRIVTGDGTVVEKDYLDFWGEDDSAWQLPFRCKVCPDGIGDAADIAAADTWDGGAPTRQGQQHDAGTNAAIVRSAAGEQLLAAATAAGFVTVNGTFTPRDMDRLQPHQVAKKRAVWARFVGMRNAGTIVPDVSRLRLKPMARTNSLATNLAEARGAKRRSKRQKQIS